MDAGRIEVVITDECKEAIEKLADLVERMEALADRYEAQKGAIHNV